MKFVVRPELPTAALRSSQATLAAVDNSAPLATRRSPLKTRGNVVQTTGATSSTPKSYQVDPTLRFTGIDTSFSESISKFVFRLDSQGRIWRRVCCAH